MSLFKITLTLFATFLMCNCASTQDKDQTASENNGIAQMESGMTGQGFLKGVIRYSEAEGDCPYTIEVESDDYNYMLDPLNLEAAYKKDGSKVWFKFTPLRMPNRCEKASPVNLTEVQQRQ